MSANARAAQMAPQRVEVAAGPLLGGGALVRDYLAGHDLSDFYSGHYTDDAAYARKAAEVEQRLDAGARAIAGAAIEPLGDAADRLARILNGDGFFVTTGQQPALFGGPLYTLYKILAAIRYADHLERVLARPVLALFWVGSEDHDWDEANHASVFDRDLRYVHRITVNAPDDAPPVPLSVRTWGNDISRAVEELAGMLPDTTGAQAVLEHVRSAYTADTTVAESFTATIRFLLRDRRLAIVDSAHPALRAAAADTMHREARHGEAHAAVLAAQTRRLEQAGYGAQVAISPDASNLMLIGEHGRDRLVRTRRGWQTRREGIAVDEARLLEMIRDNPDAFSPNVLLRPVVESAAFPTIAYVAGPGELSYFAQIGCLFAAHGILAPVVIPRPSVTLIAPAVRRLLDRLDIDAAALRRPFRDVVADAVAAEMPDEVKRSLAALRASIEASYDDLASASRSIDPTLAGPLRGARNASLREAQAAEKRITAHLRRRSETKIEQLRRAAAHIHPWNAPQERVLGPLPFVAAFGMSVIDDIADALDPAVPRVADWRGPLCEPAGAVLAP